LQKTYGSQSTGDLKTKGLALRMGHFARTAFYDKNIRGRGWLLLTRNQPHLVGLDSCDNATPIFLASGAAGFVSGPMLAVDGGILASGVNQ
jgi:hypothetical protein